MFSLLTALNESWDDVWKVGCEFVTENPGHDTKEQEAALPQPGTSQLDSVEGLLHHVTKVWTERVLAHCFCERADGIHRDAAQFLLFTLACKHKEVFEAIHRWLEVGQELLLRCMGSTSNGTDDHGLHGSWRRVEKDYEALHQQREILVNGISKDFQQGIKSGARGTLGDRIVHQLHDGLRQ